MKAKNGEEYESAIAGVSVDTLNEIEKSRLARESIKRAEARAAQLEAERDAAWLELREIRDAVNADQDEATIDEVRRVVYERDDFKVRMQSWHDSAMTLADQRDDLARQLAEALGAIAAAVAEEREACAELAKSMIGATRHEIAAAIRARSHDPH